MAESPIDHVENHTEEPAADERRLLRVIQFLLLALVGATCWPVLRAGFIHWDDGLNIINNPHLSFSWENLRWMFTDASYVRRYMPVGWISYAIDKAFFGLNPLSYHLGNLLLHCANTLLVLDILRKVLRLLRPNADSTRATVAAGLGAAWWALNPLRAEAIGWSSGRIYCAASLFYFLAVWAYLRRAEHPKRWLGMSVVCFALSLLTYPIALGGFAVFILLDVFVLKRLPGDIRRWTAAGNRRVLGEKVLFLFPFLVTFAANVWSRLQQKEWDPVVSFADFSLVARCAQAMWVWAWYFWKPWLPFNLAPKYPDLLPSVSFGPAHATAAALVIGITIVLILKRKSWPALLLAWLCHVALVVPFIGFTEHPHHTCDRYGYIPGIVWACVLAVAVASWQMKKERLVLYQTGIAAFCFLMGALLYGQTWIWKSGLSVQQAIVASLSGHPECAHEDLIASALLLEQGNAPGAETFLRDALELRPSWAEAWSALAYALSEQQKTEQSVASFRRALDLNPALDSARLNLSVTLAQAGRQSEAAEELRALLKRNPKNATAHHNLAQVLLRLGQAAEAKVHMMEARRLQGQTEHQIADSVL